jgi:hypothetical protein
MNVDLRDLPTNKLWETIISNAADGLEHTDWLTAIENIKIVIYLIDERISRFQRERLTEQLVLKSQKLDEGVKEAMYEAYRTPV